jgi:hypothetical protein
MKWLLSRTFGTSRPLACAGASLWRGPDDLLAAVAPCEVPPTATRPEINEVASALEKLKIAYPSLRAATRSRAAARLDSDDLSATVA